MEIKSIGILGGTGGLGARFETYFKAKFPKIKVKVSGRSTTLTNQYLVEQSDLVIFAVPIEQTLSVIEAMLPFAQPNQIWTDFTSIKQQPLEAMLKSKAQVCGLHPLFGPLPEIENQTLIYCPERIEKNPLSSLLKLFEAFNLMPFSPKEHDDLMGVVQCASHMSDMVMGETLRQSGFDFDTIWQVSSPSYRLKLEVMGRMFAQSPDLYADIATQNLSAPQFTDIFKQTTDKLNQIVNDRDRNQLINNFVQTKEYLTPEFCQQAYQDSQLFLSRFTASQEPEAVDNSTVDRAVFGEPGSHTDSASHDFENLTGRGSRRFYGTIYSLINALDTGEAEWGIVPFENTTEGSVLEVLDELLAHPDIQIVAATDRSIEQYLMAPEVMPLASLTQIHSHPQALAQSKSFLRAHCPQASFQAAASTAQAARKIKQSVSRNWAAVGSKALAQSMGLSLMTGNMAHSTNRTRFVLLQKNGRAKQPTVTCVAFWFQADQAGNLATVLNYFSEHNVNLLKLDSRRADVEKGEYVFFLDAAVSLDAFEKHLMALKEQVAGLQIIGSYA
jgi:prephenate dehydrogenase